MKEWPIHSLSGKISLKEKKDITKSTKLWNKEKNIHSIENSLLP
jgi:hypothetical protein